MFAINSYAPTAVTEPKSLDNEYIEGFTGDDPKDVKETYLEH
jgi:hypothetical protein